MSDLIPFIWSNDDITTGLRDPMMRQLDFLARFGIKGTFFIVPCPKGKNFCPLTDDHAVIDVLKQAQRDGHDIHQHSTTHVCFENGMADVRMFDLMGDAVKRMHTVDRHLLERVWQLDAIEAQIGWGHQVWQDAFGERSEGFRPGCGSFCSNLFRALANLGFTWISSRCVSMTGWIWAAGRIDYPFEWDCDAKPHRVGKLMEFPMLDDVAFKIPRGRIDAMVELGWRHWLRCVEQNAPFHLVSHHFALGHEDGTGYAIHEQLIARILATGQAQPLTLSAYHRQLKEGRWPEGQSVELDIAAEAIPNWHALGRVATTART